MCEGNNRTDYIPECVGCLVGLTLTPLIWEQTDGNIRLAHLTNLQEYFYKILHNTIHTLQFCVLKLSAIKCSMPVVKIVFIKNIL